MSIRATSPAKSATPRPRSRRNVDTGTTNLFAAIETCDEQDFEAILASTMRVIDALLAERPVSISWSGGKDSSVTLHIVLCVARKRAQLGLPVHPIVVLTADTLVESPEITAYARAELRAVQRFAKRHGLPLHVEVTTPRLTESWAVVVLSGRSLPSYYGGNSDCTVNMKSQPLSRAQARHDAKFPGLVTILGTRYDESTRRAANMRKRAETAEQVWIGKDERPYLSPIAYWTTDHIWTLIGTVMAIESEQTYSDFSELHRIYADASGGGCVVVAEMAGMMKSSPCGARHGCWACVRMDADKSLEAMLAADSRYEYMRPLNQLRNFLLAVRYDWSLRTWMPWDPDPDGSLEVAPYRFRPSFLAKLLRICLSIDERERQAASATGIRPRFKIIDVRSLIAIDAYWSLHGLHKPFEALRIYRDVYQYGNVVDVPVIDPVPPTPRPTAGVFQVGPWRDNHPIGGMFDPFLAISEPGGCIGSRTLRDGRIVQDVNQSAFFDVDEAGAQDLLEFCLDEFCARGNEAPVSAYITYAQYGTISVNPKYLGEVDLMVRRTWWKHRVGLDLDMDRDVLLARVRELARQYQESLGKVASAALPRRVQLELLAA